MFLNWLFLCYFMKAYIPRVIGSYFQMNKSQNSGYKDGRLTNIRDILDEPFNGTPDDDFLGPNGIGKLFPSDPSQTYKK